MADIQKIAEEIGGLTLLEARDLVKVLEVFFFKGGYITLFDRIVFVLILKHARMRSPELLLIKGFTEFLPGLFNLLPDLILNLLEVFLDKLVSTVTLFGIPVIDQRVIESSYMP